ncbi:uncharacterized protein [Amphiura filiformis]|uniref:uncharacterized protein n=1 Tax=Amphiura filiformis TaxID=82378 RepID=UPI003B2282E4
MQCPRVGIHYSQNGTPAMTDFFYLATPEKNNGYYAYAIFDGHVAYSAAVYAQQFLTRELCKTLDQDVDLSLENVADKIRLFIENFDEELMRQVSPDTGCTCCIALVNQDFIIIINIGNSKCLLFGDQLLFQTTDHKPVVSGEKNRIIRSGGRVSPDGKIFTDTVYGLHISRSLGDAWYKKNNVVVCTPDVQVIKKTDEHQYLLVGSDGMFAKRTNEEIVHYIHTSLQSIGKDQQFVCDDVVRFSHNPADNCTAILVDLRPYDDEEEVEEEVEEHAEIDLQVHK